LRSLLCPICSFFCEHIQKTLSDVAIGSGQAIKVTVQLVRTSKGLIVGYAAEKIISGYVEGIGQPPQVVEGRFTGSGFEVGNGGSLETGAICQISLAEFALLPSRAESIREDLGRSV